MTDTKRSGDNAEDRKKSGGKARKAPPRKAKGRKTEPRSAAKRSPSTKARPAADDGATPSSEPRSRRAPEDLPAFGFAEDLLSSEQAERADDPERIFAFADHLESESDDLEPVVAPVRLGTWVTFDLAGEVFALPVEPVREVLRVASITRVPHAPQPIRGVTNVRGRVIPVIDLRLRIGVPAVDLERSSRVIVVRSRGRRLGLLVDAVHQVVHLDLDRVQPPPEDVMTVQSDYIAGVYHHGEQLILLLDVDRALVIRGPGRDRPGHDRPGHDRPGREPGRDRSSRDRSGRGKPSSGTAEATR